VALWDVEGETPVQWLESGYGYDANKVAFSPDGQWLAATTIDGTLWVWSYPVLGEPRKIAAHRGPIFAAKFAPDSRSILTVGQDGLANLWDLESGKLKTKLDHHEVVVMDGRFTGDGAQLITSTLAGGLVRLGREDWSATQDSGAAFQHGSARYQR